MNVLRAFVAALRAAGMVISTDRIAGAAAALTELPTDPYWPLRVTLCSGPGDLKIFDAVWHAWPAAAGATEVPVVAAESLTAAADAATGDSAETDAGAGASTHDDLTVRDVRELTADELAEIAALVALLAPRTRLRPAMRRRPARTGRIDPHRTVRSMLRNAGEPSHLAHTRRSARPRRLLLLLDVSASMHTYSDVLLQFAHAAVVAAPATTEVFALGSRWTRLTPLLAAHDSGAALRAAAGLKAGWNGGTLLGPAMQDFLRRWAGRTAVRSAIVVISSDGLESGRLDVLPRQVARLSRLGHTLIWVNPKQARPGYRPVNPALKDSLPYATDLVSGHNYETLRHLAEVIAR
jgi:uncharacterized protein with von Willebrand factor type A (vWA) domain